MDGSGAAAGVVYDYYGGAAKLPWVPPDMMIAVDQGDSADFSNVGELCLKYGGGGHLNAGTCQVVHEDAERVLKEITAKVNADG